MLVFSSVFVMYFNIVLVWFIEDDRFILFTVTLCFRGAALLCLQHCFMALACPHGSPCTSLVLISTGSTSYQFTYTGCIVRTIIPLWMLLLYNTVVPLSVRSRSFCVGYDVFCCSAEWRFCAWRSSSSFCWALIMNCTRNKRSLNFMISTLQSAQAFFLIL